MTLPRQTNQCNAGMLVVQLQLHKFCLGYRSYFEVQEEDLLAHELILRPVEEYVSLPWLIVPFFNVQVDDQFAFLVLRYDWTASKSLIPFSFSFLASPKL